MMKLLRRLIGAVVVVAGVGEPIDRGDGHWRGTS